MIKNKDNIVTIIIPTYKGKDTILRAVNSALNQTYNNLQVIVVDDNGRGTEEQLITQKLLQNYIDNNKILYIAHEKNSNGSIARNTGSKYAIGEYICFLDDDDEFLPTKTKIQVELLNNTNSNIGMVVGSYRIKLPNGYYQDMILCQPNDFLFEYLIHTMQACSSAIMMKKSVFNKVKEWDETFKRHQDWEFFARVANEYGVIISDEICMLKYKIDRNLPTDAVIAENYRMHYLNKLSYIIDQLPSDKRKDVYAYNYFDIGKGYLKNKKFIKALQWAIKTKKPIWAINQYIIDAFSFVSKKGLTKND